MKRVLAFIVFILMTTSFTTYGKPIKLPETIFMGKVLEVNKDENNSSIRILVKGYIRGCEVYEEELIAFITDETEILVNRCNNDEKEVNFENLNIQVGDNVYLVLNEAMTKSIPPQVGARKIQITKIARD